MIEAINNFINNIGDVGPIVGCILIVLESILPILPLCVFIVINFLAFGSLVGLLISWLFTIIGCMMAFYLVRSKLQGWFNRKVRKNAKVNSLMNKVDKWKFASLVIVIAIPFTPASAINVAAGLSTMNEKKYFMALAIGKIFMVYFWGFVGLGFIESLSNPRAFIKIIIMVLIAYLLSKIISKKFNIE